MISIETCPSSTKSWWTLLFSNECPDVNCSLHDHRSTVTAHNVYYIRHRFVNLFLSSQKRAYACLRYHKIIFFACENIGPSLQNFLHLARANAEQAWNESEDFSSDVNAGCLGRRPGHGLASCFRNNFSAIRTVMREHTCGPYA